VGRFTIGSDVGCHDGRCGKLVRLIFDPVAASVTHLVVEPRRHRHMGKLVPIALVESNGDPVRLSCTLDQFHQLDDAEEMHFLDADSDGWGYGSGNALSLPYYRLESGSLGTGGVPGTLGGSRSRAPIIEDNVPPGELEVRRGDKVQALDGEVGSVQGLVIEPGSHRVTHILLQEGHLWGRKQVAIPIAATAAEGGELQVSLTQQEVEELPPVELAPNPSPQPR
jgi:hypothetical protein